MEIKQLSDSRHDTDHFSRRDAAVCVSDNYASGDVDYDEQGTIGRNMRKLRIECVLWDITRWLKVEGRPSYEELRDGKGLV